jgi:hypothetical protein
MCRLLAGDIRRSVTAFSSMSPETDPGVWHSEVLGLCRCARQILREKVPQDAAWEREMGWQKNGMGIMKGRGERGSGFQSIGKLTAFRKKV